MNGSIERKKKRRKKIPFLFNSQPIFLIFLILILHFQEFHTNLHSPDNLRSSANPRYSNIWEGEKEWRVILDKYFSAQSGPISLAFPPLIHRARGEKMLEGKERERERGCIESCR